MHSRIHLIDNWQVCTLNIGVTLGLENLTEEYDLVSTFTYLIIKSREHTPKTTVLVEYPVLDGGLSEESLSIGEGDDWTARVQQMLLMGGGVELNLKDHQGVCQEGYYREED